MKTRRKLDRIFALLLVFALIFNSQATALLAMEGGEPVTEIASSGAEPLAGTEGEAETVDGDAAVIPDGEATGDPAESGMQEEAQGGDFVLGDEVVLGSDSVSEQDDGSAAGQENASATEQESEANTLTEAEEETQINPSDSENRSGADVESGPAVDVEDDSDVTIVEEETEPQTTEQGENVQEPTVDEAETEEEYEAEVVAMGLDDEVMLTSLEGEDNEAKVIKASGSETEYATFGEAVANAGDSDTVQLLKDTAEISATITLNHSIVIELNGHTVSFSTNSKAGARIVVPKGYSLTVKGPGNMTGGVKNSSSTANIERTIQVGSSGEPGGGLTIDAQADIEGIGNYGITTIQNGAQIHKIHQCAGTFTLDTYLNNSLDVVLDFQGTTCTYLSNDGGKNDIYASTSYLTLGDGFYLKSEDIKINIATSIGGSTTFGKIHLENHWMKIDKEPVNPENLTLIQGSNEEMVNALMDNIVVNKSRVKMQNLVHDETGKLVTVYWYRTVTPGVLGNLIVLWKHDEDDERFAVKHCVYVGGKNAKDSNFGYSETTPVATIGKALELVDDTDEKKICLLDTLKISDTQTWDLPEGVTIERYKFTGLFAEIVEGGTLTLNKIEIKGDGEPSDFALIKVNAGGKLTLNEGAVLKDNNHDYNTYYTCGGAIENKGGTVEINGGIISNCQAYNGGAISCDGGKLIMDGGELSDNNTVEAGGAVMLANGAEMELNGGIITRNMMSLSCSVSKYDGKGFGGGIAVGGYRDISINPAPKLTMNGGEITWNVASECGGGIFVQANAEARIYEGLIDHNTARSVKSGNFSGGGIYVNGSKTEILGDTSNDGYLYLENALITGNVARGDTGGGIAACPTASAKVYLLNGAAIYANKTGDTQADRKKSDILIRRSTADSYVTQIDVSEYMPNGQPYLWKEFNGGDDSGAGKLHRSDYIDQYSLYTDQSYNGNVSDFSVRITNNDGGRAGGGIGTNGTVEIGTKPDVTSISASKVWNDEGHTTARPEQIKVWLLQRKQGESEYKRVLADYLVPDAEGNWGSIVFAEQPIADPTNGTLYEYTVEEDPEDLGPYESTVEEADGENNWKITNTYTATGTAQVKAKKTLTGRPEALKDQEFSFSLAPVSAVGGADGVTVIEDPNLAQTGVKNTADGTVTFDDLTYTEAGTYTYELREEDTSVAGITKDSAVYTVTVTMTDDNAGHLTPSVTYSKGGSTVDEAIFANTYKAKESTANVSAKKTLTGRPKDLQANEFKFSLTPKSAVDAAGKAITDPNAKQTDVKNGSDGKITFAALTYTEAGTYTYELKETSESGNGVTVDGTVYTVTVSVTDDNAGQLQASVAYSNGTKAVEAKDVVFANTYTAKDGKASVTATKTLTGRPNGLQANEFEFSLTPRSAVGGADGTTKITDPNAAQMGVKNAANGAVNFRELTYTEAGTYTYELKETSAGGSGVTVDGTAYTVTVTVTDDNKGQLETSVAYSKGTEVVEEKDVVFANTYKAAEGTATVKATKTLTGRANGLQDQEFNFSLTPVSAVGADGETAITDPNMDEATNPEKLLTASNDADGNVTFKELTYTQAGTYTYEMKEADTDEAGITIDPATYTVTVSVTDNNLGQLITDVKYSKDDQEVDAEEVIFANTYKPAENSIQLEATKMFDRALVDGEFTFVLQEVDQDGKAVATGIRQEKTNGSDGKILFDEISYSKEGTYYYQISETAGSDPTILSYDASVRTVTVTVEDVDAKLVATADLTADEVSFTNTSVRVKLDKQDTETGASIPGAVLRIVDKNNGTVVEQWTTDGTPHEILGKLGKNGSYALEEVSAPDGYMPTGPIDFTVNEKGETVISGQVTDTVVMKDTKNTVSLLKLDENGQPLSGAHLVIETTDGTAVDSWISDGTPHVTRGLARGHYVLSEVEAPAGYHVAEDVPFEITGTETQPVEVQMTDKKIPEKDNNKLTVMKHLHLDGITCDIGVHDAVFYVALFDDEAKTHRVSDVKALSFKDSAVSTTEFENLGKGTYYVGETDENGVLKESEVINDRVIYYAEYGENAKVEFEGRKGEATSELTNVYVEIPEEGFYLSGRLTITKKVLLGGEEATSDNTFYAGVFSDTSLTSRVGNAVAIGMNGGSSASVTVYDLPIGETLDSSATYYVAETDENGTPLDPDAVTEYQISIDQSEVVLNASNSEQEVVITNDFVEEETETEEETDVPDAPGTTPGSGTPAPKTGDETNYLLYLLYMALSAGLFAVAAGEKHRKRRRARK